MVAPVITAMSAAITASGALNKIRAAGKTAQSASTAIKAVGAQGSLTDIAKMSRVEPLAVIDSNCIHLEYMPDVMQSLLSIFTGYYLQAVSILGTIDAVKVVNTLAAVNPTRDSALSFSRETYDERGEQIQDGKWKLAAEAYTYKLPMNRHGVAMETSTVSAAIVNKDVSATVRDAVNLSVGKMVSVTLSESDGGSKVTLPISVRLQSNSLASNALVSLLTLDSRDTTLRERYHAWRAGRIDFINDLILCQDMIDERKRLLMNDKTGMYSSLVARANDHKAAGLFTQNPSLASASNIVVISDSTKKLVEDKLGSKLSDARTRTKIFESGYMMILAVVDTQYERVTFYHRGVATPTTVGVRDLRVSNKGGGPDIGDVLKALGQGNAITL